MNTILKATAALGAAGLSLLALAGGAGAQTTVGDPTLNTVFSTLISGRTPSFSVGALGVGFDPNLGGGKLPSSTTQGTAQTVYEAFRFTSSASGAFTTLASGSKAQIQVFAANQNVNGNPRNPFDIYASLYAFNPNSATGSVPATGSNLFGAQQKVTLGQATGGYFSGDFTLTGGLIAGDTYVLGITTLSNDTQDFASVAVSSATNSGLSAGDTSFDRNKFLTDVNDQGNPLGKPATTVGGNNFIAFRLDAAPATNPVPEASSVVSMGLLLGLGAAFIAFKRRRSVAK